MGVLQVFEIELNVLHSTYVLTNIFASRQHIIVSIIALLSIHIAHSIQKLCVIYEGNVVLLEDRSC